MTKEGRKRIQEDREAWIGERIGVRGADLKNLQKRAEEEFKHVGNAAVQARATAGEAIALLEASKRGILTNPMLTNPRLMNDEFRNVVFKNARKEGQVGMELAHEIERERAAAATAGTAFGPTEVHEISRRVVGRLNAGDLAKQNMNELVPAMENAVLSVGGDLLNANENYLLQRFTTMTTEQQAAFRRDINGANQHALQNPAAGIPGYARPGGAAGPANYMP